VSGSAGPSNTWDGVPNDIEALAQLTVLERTQVLDELCRESALDISEGFRVPALDGVRVELFGGRTAVLQNVRKHVVGTLKRVSVCQPVLCRRPSAFVTVDDVGLEVVRVPIALDVGHGRSVAGVVGGGGLVVKHMTGAQEMLVRVGIWKPRGGSATDGKMSTPKSNLRATKLKSKPESLKER